EPGSFLCGNGTGLPCANQSDRYRPPRFWRGYHCAGGEYRTVCHPYCRAAGRCKYGMPCDAPPERRPVKERSITDERNTVFRAMPFGDGRAGCRGVAPDGGKRCPGAKRPCAVPGRIGNDGTGEHWLKVCGTNSNFAWFFPCHQL